jgi:hemoglobin-like flavoprotein
MAIEAGGGDVAGTYASRPSSEVVAAVRSACQRLLARESEFVERFSGALLHLVPRLAEAAPDAGQSLAEGLGRAVLWAALTEDRVDVIEATFQNIGSDYAHQGFPQEGYHGVGHALLRAARDTYSAEWTSELSSGWVAFYGWLGAHLIAGARLADVPAAGEPDLFPPQQAPAPEPQPEAQQQTKRQPRPEPEKPAWQEPRWHEPAPLDPSSRREPGWASAHAGPDAAEPGGDSVGYGAHAFGRPVERSASGEGTGSLALDRHDPPVMASTLTAPSSASPSRSPVDQAGGRPGIPPGFEPYPGNAGNPEFGPQTLDDVLALLQSRFFSGNDRALGAILTRVALRTGADLRAPRPDQRDNPAVIANVLAVLQVMGYVVEPTQDTLQVVFATDPQREREAKWWNRDGAPPRGWRRAVPGLFR